MKKALQSFVILVGFFVPNVWAAKHPVPLDPKADTATCVQCHEDKSKGKVVHAAVETGCLTCHFVRTVGENTNVVLRTPKTITLCAQCHEDKKASTAKGHVHPPVARDCVLCHTPHVSEEKFLLKKQPVGDKAANLCSTCHTQGLDTPEKGSRHAALDMGCNSCHTTHKSGERGNQEFDFHLSKAVPALCIECHDVKDQALQKSHNGQPFGTANCTQCHDPHQSKSAKLLQANVHPAFEGKDSCTTCHESPTDGKVKLTQADSRALCATCHEEAVKKIDAAKVQHPGAQGECTACHDPHAGKASRFLKPNAVQPCLTCHSDQQATFADTKSTLHDPVFNQKCSICHEAHGSNNQKLLRADVDQLCMSCHGVDAKAVANLEDGTESVMGKQIVLPKGYVGNTPKIFVTRVGAPGHPVPAHPTSGNDPRGKNKPLTCVSCHDPHGGKAKNMLLSKDGSQRAMCNECHQSKE